jgi:hypothetical protein
MNVKEFINTINLTNINVIKINGTKYSIMYIRDNYSDKEIESVNINTFYRTLTKDDIQYSLVTDDVETVVQYFDVEYQLPNSSGYISIELNIILKERR